MHTRTLIPLSFSIHKLTHQFLRHWLDSAKEENACSHI
uniref:Uncharacterized protein n=1 Tax=Anguilla anguilla TaxID=7936 RepID=A0A0E9TSC8_ANGAN